MAAPRTSQDDGGRLPTLQELVDRLREQMGADFGGPVVLDDDGPALYVLSATPHTFVACRACRHVQLVMSIPRRPELVWTHAILDGGCGRHYRLKPPRAVLAYGFRPVVPPARA